METSDTQVSELPELFHYSSPAGFMGILRSKSLWLSNIHYQNDIEEYNYAYKIMKEVIEKYYKGFPFTDRIQGNVTGVFTFSFSEREDLLSQWRGYCPNGGYAFSFKEDFLQNIVNTNDLILEKCMYDKNEQIECIKKKVIGFTPEEWEQSRQDAEVGKTSMHYYYHRISRDIPQKLARVAPIMKHEKFREEAEWRLIKHYIDPGSENYILNSRIGYNLAGIIKFREAKDIIVPYIEIPLVKDKGINKVELSTIVVGPGPRQELSMQACKQLTFEFGGSVRRSEIPYRNW